MKGKFLTITVSIIAVIVLAGSVRGLLGNPTASELNTPRWSEGGPFELSVERGRFSVTFSLIEDGSFHYSIPLARFAVPDLGYKDGKYVSLFAPGLSFLIAPGYLLGKLIGSGPLLSYATVSLFAFLNFLLVGVISRKLGASLFTGSLAGLTFLFATPAFAYSVSLYQHHASTLLILTSIYLLTQPPNFKRLALVWFFMAFSFTVDYPNLVMFVPIALFALVKTFNVKKSPIKLLSVLAVVPPLVLLGYFNLKSYGNPFQLAGTISGVRAIDAQGRPGVPQAAQNTQQDLERFVRPEIQKKSAVNFFKSRNLLNGLYIHFISPDRGIIYFAPIVILAIFGASYLFRSHHPLLPLLISVLGINLVLYSLWGDPWGGWGFGSRYLIPSYALSAIFIGVGLSKSRPKPLVSALFFALFVYSVAVNLAGALTSSANPPQVEILALEKISGMQQKYTVGRNFDHLSAGRLKSFAFKAFGSKYFNSWQYYHLILFPIVISGLGLLVGHTAYERH
ncbi:hypothetical protein A2634_05150 [Candidatus Amesbacteria bacterium RIFCSPHIGHO2_01_FULL_48_32]|uniref:Glycosyltransferase RgtA/B/C/D-like domain-containing protein n=1 Tax=Candidatus Amesbacteria bacterium RIFCSPLOWO2_01_FULL_48_25 TaxID=1797259 RepID=A0A1F4ZD16_9BACT|nr:MAG: hypothetical protein A2634_05150 [Candidatus Amesbacteria bacterium RIFCSPHIGHO2_01_FULL_48_32]OGD04055.1 MAG: hypothetical protein A2989_01495 [Candidatus Amesbacteria bacterium RIFCSPLOWO2_01_FULL_48_25]HJZ05681.1 hypothetical protein [Patescibacteria group bacterium]